MTKTPGKAAFVIGLSQEVVDRSRHRWYRAGIIDPGYNSRPLHLMASARATNKSQLAPVQNDFAGLARLSEVDCFLELSVRKVVSDERPNIHAAFD